MYLRCCALFVFSSLAASLAALPAFATEARVGEAVVVQNNVERVADDATNPVKVGDSMLRDEVVRTGIDSAARFVMADSTNLSIGPAPASSSTAPSSTTSTAIATSRFS